VTRKDGVAPSHSKNEHHGETGLKKKIVLLIIPLACLAILTTAGPKLAVSWKNPNYAGVTFKNILMLAPNGRAANRMEFDDE
jgi:hypothetical protein